MKLHLLRECRRGHGERHGLLHLLRVKGERWRVVHAVLNAPLIGTKLLVLIALVSIATTRLIAKTTLSVIAVTPIKAATTAAVVATRSVLSLVSKHLLLPIRVTTITVVLAVAVEVPPAAGVAIPAVVPKPPTSPSP